MNILLIVLAVIAIVLVFVFIAAAFTANVYTIECEIIINRPRQFVFDYVRLLDNQAHYNKWVMIDPNAKKICKGTDGTVGFVSAWDSMNKNAGKGEQEIKNISNGERIDLEIRFEKPIKVTSTSYMSTTALSENQTKVKWGFSGERNYMMKVLHLVLNLKKMLSKDIETSLVNLKKVLEK